MPRHPKAMSLRLPFPPSMNSIWRAVPGRGMILSRAGRKYREDAIWVIHTQVSPDSLMNARLQVLIEVFPPDRRKRDLSNIPKAVEDAITKSGKVWNDDEQIDDLRLVRREIKKPAEVVVHIRELPKSYSPSIEELEW